MLSQEEDHDGAGGTRKHLSSSPTGSIDQPPHKVHRGESGYSADRDEAQPQPQSQRQPQSVAPGAGMAVSPRRHSAAAELEPFAQRRRENQVCVCSHE